MGIKKSVICFLYSKETWPLLRLVDFRWSSGSNTMNRRYKWIRHDCRSYSYNYIQKEWSVFAKAYVKDVRGTIRLKWYSYAPFTALCRIRVAIAEKKERNKRWKILVNCACWIPNLSIVLRFSIRFIWCPLGNKLGSIRYIHRSGYSDNGILKRSIFEWILRSVCILSN